jgi:uncharacterized protein (DUF1697 family)
LRVATHVALLRGINVGGRRAVAMADLREVVGALGHENVSTYIQSGNVLFTTHRTDSRAMALELEEAIATELGVATRAIVLSRGELEQVIRSNPYPGEANPKSVHVLFLDQDPGPELLRLVADAQSQAAAKGSRDSAGIVGRTIFLHTPDGYGRSQLAARLAQGTSGRSGPAATARNWATVSKLLALCEE